MKRIYLLFAITLCCLVGYSQTIETVISPPEGYKRIEVPGGSFSQYLRNLPLLPAGSKVLYYNGEEKRNQSAAYAVINMDVGKRDLQQCADAVIRLRAEYLYANKKYDQIHFNFTNGFKADYKKWIQGYRISVKGNDVSWYQSKGIDYSYPTFRTYLDIVFTYAGTLSLSRELKKVPYSTLSIGDVFIQGGSPGHAVIVTDVAINPATGKKVFLLAQSYMPAQSIHILTNPANKALSPWYELEQTEEGKLYTPEWTFNKIDLKRFK